MQISTISVPRVRRLLDFSLPGVSSRNRLADRNLPCGPCSTVPPRWVVFVNTGVFTPVLAKHNKHLSLVDILAVGVDRMQRNFEPMRKQVEAWKGTRLPDETAKLVIYRAFVEGELDVPKHLARRVHDLYFNPQIEEFAPRTTWSLSNAFTSAFKELDPIPQFKTTAKLASFIELAAIGLN